MNDNSPGKPPKQPNSSQSYGTGVNTYFQYLPEFLQAEMDARDSTTTGDTARLQHQQELQNEFGPTQYHQQTQALQDLNPDWYKLQSQTGRQLSNNLSNPENQGQYSQLGKTVFGNLATGNNINPYLSNNNQLISQLQGDLKQGYGLAPGQEQQVEQGVRGSQAARGNILGSAAGTAEAYALGDRGNQMYQQRLQNALQIPGLGAQNVGMQQQNIGNAANYLNMASPQQRAIGNALGFQQASTPSQQLSLISPISPDRSSAYVNPNAGFQGQQFSLQNYQNSLGAYGIQNQQSGNNPWMSGIGAAGSIFGSVAPWLMGVAGGI